MFKGLHLKVRDRTVYVKSTSCLADLQKYIFSIFLKFNDETK